MCTAKAVAPGLPAAAELACAMWPNTCPKARGITPAFSSVTRSRMPIVYVLPVPVCPYANTVPL